MQVLPVLDLQRGIAVHAIAGERHRYQALSLPGLDAPTPLSVARWYENCFGLRNLYVADLSAIVDDQPAWSAYEALSDSGFGLLLDAGLALLRRDVSLTSNSWGAACDGMVLGLESVESEETFAQFIERFGVERSVFSLDLRGGQPMTNVSSFSHGDPLAIVESALARGFRRFIVLDLKQVGRAAGLSVLDLCGELRRRWPEVEIASGGGVRDVGDLRRLSDAGCSHALVATALQRGTITAEDLAEFSPP